MKRLSIVALVATGMCVAATALAQQAEVDGSDLREQAASNPNDYDALNKYVGYVYNQVALLAESQPDEAEQKLQELKQFLEGLEADDASAKTLIERALAVADRYQQHIDLARTTLEELQSKLEQDPTDLETLRLYGDKALQQISRLARSEPAQAEENLNKVRQVLEELSEPAEEKEELKEQIASIVSRLERLKPTIEAGRKLAELIGKDAAPLEVDAWVNGEPLAPEDLKGKVVLLDFWAVWCDPCIATFPHLRQWQEQYADDGLVIVGLTKYYNYEWDEEAGRAQRAQEEVTPEQEHKMLEKFAQEHELQHRFGVTKENELSQYYGVTGIPHAVVIDREGKIRLIRVGSGSANAEDIDKLIQELL